MLLTSIRLRNYRVFAELELEIPPGLVGIYGPNGAGKSSLLESIMWALYGKARTSKGEIRTSGVSGECVAELGFVHDDDHYVVRRTISGVNATVKARVEVGGSVAADSPNEVAKFLRSTIGMDEAAFRSSVFAEQKQLAAFSDNSPDQRRKLILQLLGITPIERARDAARADYKGQSATYGRLVAMLPVVEELEERVRSAREQSDATQHADDVAQRHAETARKLLDEVRDAEVETALKKSQHDLITSQGKAARQRRDIAQQQLDALLVESRELDEITEALEDLGPAPSTESIADDRARLALVMQVDAAVREFAQLRSPPDSVVIDEAPLLRAQEALASASDRATEAKSLWREAERAVKSAQTLLQRTSELDGDACPLCGQDLLLGVEGIRKHRNEELRAAKQLLDERSHLVRVADDLRKQALVQAQQVERSLAEARLAQQQALVERTRYDTAKQRVDGLVDQLGPTGEDEAQTLRDRIQHVEHATKTRAGYESKLQRVPKIRSDISALHVVIADAEALRNDLRAQLTALAFDASAYETMKLEVSKRRQAEEAGQNKAKETARLRAAAAQQLASASGQLSAALEQHEKSSELSTTIRYLGRTADLLGGFRQAVVSAVGPRLTVEASALFNQLTANEYDGLEVHPETYAIHIVDAGVAYPSERFSGSEVDLANLALRVAISEQVRFQAGGQVGLLVLDEALASLDTDRKDRMLAALTQLSARFRQILLVTHSAEVKDQLPMAIEIRKRAGRRGLAELVDFGQKS